MEMTINKITVKGTLEELLEFLEKYEELKQVKEEENYIDECYKEFSLQEKSKDTILDTTYVEDSYNCPDNQEYENINKKLKVFNIIERFPEELGMILDCKNYSEYVKTFLDIDYSEEDVEITKEEFNLVKDYFQFGE